MASVRRGRLHSQRLVPPSRDDGADVAGVVPAAVGIQAQNEAAAALAIRARSSLPTAADVASARWNDRSVVRTWCMRGTLQLVAVDDLAWLLSVFGPVYVQRGRRRLEDLGFDDVGRFLGSDVELRLDE